MATSNQKPIDDQIQRRRAFTNKLNLRRQVYHELTSYQVFPLQEMAKKDLDEKLKNYLGTDCNSDDENSVGVDRTACIFSKDASATNTELESLREQYRQEFLVEKLHPSGAGSIRAAAAVVPCIDRVQGAKSETAAAAAVVTTPNEDGERHETQQDNPQQCENEQINTCESNDSESLSKQVESSTQTQRIDNISINTKHEAQTNDLSHVQTNIDNIEAQPTSGKSSENAPTQCIYNVQSNESETSAAQQNHPPNSDTLPQDQTNSETTNESTHISALWSMEPRLFALETSGTGKRRYISSHLGRFMDHYWRKCDVYNRHYYELIRESTPCRLYFDLEFSKSANVDITPEIAECILTELFEEIQIQFKTLYGTTIQRQNLVDLDSSTSKKFSRHWIFHLPNGELFGDARAAGAFVKLLVARLEEEKESGELESKGHENLAKYLLVNAESSNDDDIKLTRFIDMGVYTRNRLFRILGSTKFGKRPDAALRIADANEFEFPEEFSNAKFYLPAINAISGANDNSDNDGGLEFDQFCKSHDWEGHATALECTLVVPAHTTKLDYPILPDPESLLGDESQQKLVLEAGWRCRTNGSSFTLMRPSNTHGRSPFPKLEEFIVNTLGQRKGLSGSIGTYSLGIQLPLPRTISFNMVGNRWCENVGRAHKSNNIIWNVYLMDRVCWQSCHDPDCRGFRGESIDLPTEIHTEIDEYFLERELSSLNFDNQRDATPTESNEFDDPDLEEGMQNLDIKAAESAAVTEEEFDDPLLEMAMKNLAL
ncbi:hypothetical protein ACHAXN_013182 [Cyclotella atomus]